MGKGTEQTFLQRRHANGQQVYEKMLNSTNHQGNPNQNYSEILPHSSLERLLLKRQEIKNIGKKWRKGNPCTLLECKLV